MTKAMKLRFQGTVSTRGDATPLIKVAGDAVLVERGRPRLLLLSCPCGCGEEFPINLDPRSGPAWRLYKDTGFGHTYSRSSWLRDGGALSLFPSVWRESGCRSHYIIWHSNIMLFGFNDEDFESDLRLTGPMLESIYQQLPKVGLISFREIAEVLDAVPWDVLIACRELVKTRRASEGQDKQRGMFGRI